MKISMPFLSLILFFFEAISMAGDLAWPPTGNFAVLRPAVVQNRETTVLVQDNRWSAGWNVVAPITIPGNRFLFLLKSSGTGGDGYNVHVNRVNADGTIGDVAWRGKWDTGWTHAVAYESGGKGFVFLLRNSGYVGSGDGYNAMVVPVLSNGTLGPSVWTGHWTEGYSAVATYKSAGRAYLFIAKRDSPSEPKRAVVQIGLNSNYMDEPMYYDTVYSAVHILTSSGVGDLVEKGHGISEGWDGATSYVAHTGLPAVVLYRDDVSRHYSTPQFCEYLFADGAGRLAPAGGFGYKQAVEGHCREPIASVAGYNGIEYMMYSSGRFMMRSTTLSDGISLGMPSRFNKIVAPPSIDGGARTVWMIDTHSSY